MLPMMLLLFLLLLTDIKLIFPYDDAQNCAIREIGKQATRIISQFECQPTISSFLKCNLSLNLSSGLLNYPIKPKQKSQINQENKLSIDFDFHILSLLFEFRLVHIFECAITLIQRSWRTIMIMMWCGPFEMVKEKCRFWCKNHCNLNLSLSLSPYECDFSFSPLCFHYAIARMFESGPFVVCSSMI